MASTADISIREEIIAEIERIARQQNKVLADLTDDLLLLESGLDSLCVAILVAGLEERLELDPFFNDDGLPFPVTLGDFIKRYEAAAG